MHACVLEFKGVWNKYLPLIKFSYNNSFQAMIGMVPYEALYGRKCRSPVHWFEIVEKHIATPDFIKSTTEAIKLIRERIETAQSRQKYVMSTNEDDH